MTYGNVLVAVSVEVAVRYRACACAGAGPTCVMEAGFNVKRVPASTRSYVDRATALHEYYLAGAAARVRNLLLVQNRVRTAGSES